MLIIKRCLDIFFSSVLLIILSPIMIITAIIVKVKMGSPILFKQVRPGKNGKPFMMYKFRTMLDDKDDQGNLSSDAQRLTKFGQLLRSSSIDELPELFNILKGDMSFVGPRPLLMEYLPLYNSRQAKRHEVTPGLTGWAQVNGRNSINWDEKLELDVWYVENRTLLLDMKIVFLTFFKVFRREGISHHGSATMEKFKG